MVYILGDSNNSRRPIIHTGDNSDLIRIANEVDEKNKGKDKPKEEVTPVNETYPTFEPQLNDFIYIEPIKLYFGKKRVLQGKNWYQTHEELQKKGLKMPTLTEFVGVSKYLRDNPSGENTQLYNEIFELIGRNRSNWLDADFKFINNEIYINYEHELKNGVLVPKYHEKLESCLMEDGCAGISLNDWLDNPTKNGLPQSNVKKGSLWYLFPRSDNNSVVTFGVHLNIACLSCSISPTMGSNSLGVYPCFKSKNENETNKKPYDILSWNLD